MKKANLFLIIGLVLVVFTVNALAGIDEFLGNWKNIDPHTGGITRVEIFLVGANVYVHAWGKCHPSDCDWGSVLARVYAPGVGADLLGEARAISAVYNESFKRSILSIHPHPTAPNVITVECFDHFTDNSGRTDYSAEYHLERQMGLGMPAQLSPANGSVFHHYPRTTTLRWTAVPGAASYTVEIDCFHCCGFNRWCTDIGQTWKVMPNIHGTSYTFNFVGAQPGRWRVWAVDAHGNEGPRTPWWEFKYTQ